MSFSLLSLRRSSIRFRLIALVLLPIAGLTVLAGDRALDRDRTAQTARLVRADAEMTAELTQALVVVKRELDIATGFSVGSEFGVGPEALEQVLGLFLGGGSAESDDIIRETFADLQESQARYGGTDPDSLASIMAIGREVEAIAANTDSSGNSVEEIDEVRQKANMVFTEVVSFHVDSLWRHQGGLDNSVDLTAAIRTSDHVIDLVEATRIDALATSRFLVPASEVEVSGQGSERQSEIELAVARARFELAVSVLERNLAPSLVTEFNAMRATDAWKDHQDLLHDLSRGRVAPLTLDGRPNEVGVSLFASLGFEFDELRLVVGLIEYQAVLAEFQRSANQRIVSESVELESVAESDVKQAILLAVLLLVVTVAGAALTARSILFPLQQVKSRAQDISRGSLAAVRPVNMPNDLHAVVVAFDDLTTSLRALDRQASYLARGELDNAVLDKTIAGPLGRSIHGSVEKLRQLNTRLEYQANHDALTSLPNRAAILGRLDRNLTGSLQTRVPSTVMLLDLDGFKHANDSLGHVVGDEVLCRVAERLERRADGHMVGRLGGDEFMVILDEELDADASEDFAKSLLDGFVEPIASSAGTVWLSVCVGVVRTGHSNWLSPAEVMQRVDVALYEGKSRGPGSLVLFNQQLHDNVLNQSSLQSRLRKALSADELELHYQPVLSVSGDVGVEALLRWSPDGESPIPPDVFIAAAEQSELIFHIDEWVMDRACRQLAEWSSDPELADVTMSINISGRHVANYQLPDKLMETMAKYKVKPGQLILEVTETELIPSLEQSIGVLTRIRELGVKLAIDDFGTGFASVAHLRRVRFDRIKIDRAFVWSLDDPTERSIANLLASLGVDLKLEVVAEGVETAAQLAWATQAGCTHLQGYFFARPMPAAEIRSAVLSIREKSSVWFAADQESWLLPNKV